MFGGLVVAISKFFGCKLSLISVFLICSTLSAYRESGRRNNEIKILRIMFCVYVSIGIMLIKQHMFGLGSLVNVIWLTLEFHLFSFFVFFPTVFLRNQMDIKKYVTEFSDLGYVYFLVFLNISQEESFWKHRECCFCVLWKLSFFPYMFSCEKSNEANKRLFIYFEFSCILSIPSFSQLFNWTICFSILTILM